MTRTILAIPEPAPVADPRPEPIAEGPTRIAVIIPYYQRDKGILSRAVTSVLGQELPSATTLRVIVVDDASPLAAEIDLAE
jgi:cellulose synthase/poly-beta-1,6-N-acetylglucosamine synthase-like glycosyltransferase